MSNRWTNTTRFPNLPAPADDDIVPIGDMSEADSDRQKHITWAQLRALTAAGAVVDTIDPTADDDDYGGYAIGSLWHNSTDGGLFVCTDATTGAAVWEEISTGGGGGASVTVSDTAPATPAAGDLWWDSSIGQMFVYYDDGSSSQWVSANPVGSGVVGVDLGLTTDQVMTRLSWTAIEWEVENRDDDGFFAAGSPTIITIPTAGWYTLEAVTRWYSTTAAFVTLRFVCSTRGSVGWASHRVEGASTSTVSSTAIAYLQVGETVQVQAYHDDATGETILASEARFAAVRIGG